MHTYVIAELGGCHDGRLHEMLAGVRQAKSCGADAIKLQWTSDPVKMANRRGKAREDGYADIYRTLLSWPKSWHERVSSYARSLGIDYMCTVYLPEDVAVVAPWVSKFKISSFEALDDAMVESHLHYDKQIVLSTGMLDHLGVMGNAAFEKMTRDKVAVLQCVSAYPAPLESLNLCVLWNKYYDGLSDHTEPDFTWTGALAVAAGATIIEAHMRVPQTSTDNPDYPHAMDARQLEDYIRHIRFAETCVGGGPKRVHKSEQPMAKYQVEPSEI